MACCRQARRWNLLATNISTDEIVARVPVNTVLSAFLAQPGIGVGIYDREGVVAGQSYTRTYTITRTKGGAQPKSYAVSWVGNDGTFSSPATIALPLNVPVESARHDQSGDRWRSFRDHEPRQSQRGGHRVPDDERRRCCRHIQPSQWLLGHEDRHDRSCAAADALRARAGGRTGAEGRLLGTDHGCRDGAGTLPALASVRAGHRFERSIELLQRRKRRALAHARPGAPLRRTTGAPLAGVWEITVDARRSSDTDFAPYTMTASILGATVSPNPDVIASASVGVPIARSYTITNGFGPFTGRATGSTLGSANRLTPTIANLEQQQFQVTVAPGSSSLRATIGGTSDPAADLDLFVFNCTTGTCVLAGSNADGDSEESVTIANPAAGVWVVLVDGFAVPAGTTTFNYIDVFVNAAFGSVAVTDANALRPAGASWTVPGIRHGECCAGGGSRAVRQRARADGHESASWIRRRDRGERAVDALCHGTRAMDGPRRHSLLAASPHRSRCHDILEQQNLRHLRGSAVVEATLGLLEFCGADLQSYAGAGRLFSVSPRRETHGRRDHLELTLTRR